MKRFGFIFPICFGAFIVRDNFLRKHGHFFMFEPPFLPKIAKITFFEVVFKFTVVDYPRRAAFKKNPIMLNLLSGLVAGDSAICGRLAALILRLRPAGLRFEEFRSPVKRGGLGLRFSNRSGLRPAAIWICGHKPKFRSHSGIGCDFGAGWRCGWKATKMLNRIFGCKKPLFVAQKMHKIFMYCEPRHSSQNILRWYENMFLLFCGMGKIKCGFWEFFLQRFVCLQPWTCAKTME